MSKIIFKNTRTGAITEVTPRFANAFRESSVWVEVKPMVSKSKKSNKKPKFVTSTDQEVTE